MNIKIDDSLKTGIISVLHIFFTLLKKALWN